MLPSLTTPAQFAAVLAGRPLAVSAHFAWHCGWAGNDPSAQALGLVAAQAPWLGLVVPKRHARRAVTRNLIKRQVRALLAELAPRLAPTAHVLRLRAPFDRAQFVSAASPALKCAVRAELLGLIDVASRRGALRAQSAA